MSEDSLNLVLLIKVHKSSSDMAKVQIKSEKITPFGGIFSIMEQFDVLLSNVIDSTLESAVSPSATATVKYSAPSCACSSAVVLALKMSPHIL